MNFKQLPNGMCEGFALLKKCDVKKTKNGAAYLDLILGDKSDELPAKLWDYTDNGLFAPDMVVKVRGTVEQYNGRDQFRISQIRPAADSDNYNLSDLVPASEVQIAPSTSGVGRALRARANQATMIVGDRNCSTVAVAALDFSMVIRKVNCTVSAPNSEKNSRLRASRRFCSTRKMRSP